MLTPYRADVNAAVRRYIEARGCEVPVFGSFNEEDDHARRPHLRRRRSATPRSTSGATRGSTRSSWRAPACAWPRRRPRSKPRSASPSRRATMPWPGTPCASPGSPIRCEAGGACSRTPADHSGPHNRPSQARGNDGDHETLRGAARIARSRELADMNEPTDAGAGNLAGAGLRRTPDVPATSASLGPTATILAGAATVAALYLGRDVLIPLALAILLSFALGPLVTWLYRRGLPRVPAVLTVMLLVTVLFVGFAALVASQLTHLAQQLPTYEYNLRLKAREVAEAAPGAGVITRTADFLRDFSREIDRITEGRRARSPRLSATPAGETSAAHPGRGPSAAATAAGGAVRVRRSPVAADRDGRHRPRVHRLRAAPARGPARPHDPAVRPWRCPPHHRRDQRCGQADRPLPADAARGQCPLRPAGRDRPVPDRSAQCAALGRASHRSALHPLSWARSWRRLCRLRCRSRWTRVGPPQSSPSPCSSRSSCSPTTCSSPGCTARAQASRRSPSSSPRCSGPRLWGPVGLLLATPLTVCLVVLGRHVPQLQFFEVLLGDQPVLAPEVKLYQRILAGDPHEAGELAEEQLEERPLLEVLDAVVSARAGVRRPGSAAGRPRPRSRDDRRRPLHRGGGGPRRSDRAARRRRPPSRRDPAFSASAHGPGWTRSRPRCSCSFSGRRATKPRRPMRPPCSTAARPPAPGTSYACPIWMPGPCDRRDRLLLRLRARLGREARYGICLWGASADEAEQARAVTRAELVATSLAQAVELIGAAPGTRLRSHQRSATPRRPRSVHHRIL